MKAAQSFKRRVEELESYTRSGQLEKSVAAYRSCITDFPDKLKQIDCDALHSAVIYGHPETLMALINEGADVNVENAFKQTALSFAASNEHLDIFSLLIRAGADVNAVDNWGSSLLHKFCTTQYISEIDEKMAMLLIDSGADPNFVRPSTGWSCLQMAANHGHLRLCHRLLEKGADVNFLSEHADGPRTALHCAALSNSKDVVIKLLLMGADMFTPKDSNHWPINLANEKKAFGSVMVLIAAGAQSGYSGHSFTGVFTVHNGPGQRLLVDRLSACIYTGDPTLISKALDEDPSPVTLSQRVKLAMEWNKKHGFIMGLPMAQSLAAAKLARMAMNEIVQPLRSSSFAS